MQSRFSISKINPIIGIGYSPIARCMSNEGRQSIAKRLGSQKPSSNAIPQAGVSEDFSPVQRGSFAEIFQDQSSWFHGDKVKIPDPITLKTDSSGYVTLPNSEEKIIASLYPKETDVKLVFNEYKDGKGFLFVNDKNETLLEYVCFRNKKFLDIKAREIKIPKIGKGIRAWNINDFDGSEELREKYAIEVYRAVLIYLQYFYWDNNQEEFIPRKGIKPIDTSLFKGVAAILQKSIPCEKIFEAIGEYPRGIYSTVFNNKFNVLNQKAFPDLFDMDTVSWNEESFISLEERERIAIEKYKHFISILEENEWDYTEKRFIKREKPISTVEVLYRGVMKIGRNPDFNEELARTYNFKTYGIIFHVFNKDLGSLNRAAYPEMLKGYVSKAQLIPKYAEYEGKLRQIFESLEGEKWFFKCNMYNKKIVGILGEEVPEALLNILLHAPKGLILHWKKDYFADDEERKNIAIEKYKQTIRFLQKYDWDITGEKYVPRGKSITIEQVLAGPVATHIRINIAKDSNAVILAGCYPKGIYKVFDNLFELDKTAFPEIKGSVDLVWGVDKFDSQEEREKVAKEKVREAVDYLTLHEWNDKENKFIERAKPISKKNILGQGGLTRKELAKKLVNIIGCDIANLYHAVFDSNIFKMNYTVFPEFKNIILSWDSKNSPFGEEKRRKLAIEKFRILIGFVQRNKWIEEEERFVKREYPLSLNSVLITNISSDLGQIATLINNPSFNRAIMDRLGFYPLGIKQAVFKNDMKELYRAAYPRVFEEIVFSWHPKYFSSEQERRNIAIKKYMLLLKYLKKHEWDKKNKKFVQRQGQISLRNLLCSEGIISILTKKEMSYRFIDVLGFLPSGMFSVFNKDYNALNKAAFPGILDGVIPSWEKDFFPSEEERMRIAKEKTEQLIWYYKNNIWDDENKLLIRREEPLSIRNVLAKGISNIITITAFNQQIMDDLGFYPSDLYRNIYDYNIGKMKSVFQEELKDIIISWNIRDFSSKKERKQIAIKKYQEMVQYLRKYYWDFREEKIIERSQEISIEKVLMAGTSTLLINGRINTWIMDELGFYPLGIYGIFNNNVEELNRAAFPNLYDKNGNLISPIEKSEERLKEIFKEYTNEIMEIYSFEQIFDEQKEWFYGKTKIPDPIPLKTDSLGYVTLPNSKQKVMASLYPQEMDVLLEFKEYENGKGFSFIDNQGNVLLDNVCYRNSSFLRSNQKEIKMVPLRKKISGWDLRDFNNSEEEREKVAIETYRAIIIYLQHFYWDAELKEFIKRNEINPISVSSSKGVSVLLQKTVSCYKLKEKYGVNPGGAYGVFASRFNELNRKAFPEIFNNKVVLWDKELFADQQEREILAVEKYKEFISILQEYEWSYIEKTFLKRKNKMSIADILKKGVIKVGRDLLVNEELESKYGFTIKKILYDVFNKDIINLNRAAFPELYDEEDNLLPESDNYEQETIPEIKQEPEVIEEAKIEEEDDSVVIKKDWNGQEIENNYSKTMPQIFADLERKEIKLIPRSKTNGGNGQNGTEKAFSPNELQKLFLQTGAKANWDELAKLYSELGSILAPNILKRAVLQFLIDNQKKFKWPEKIINTAGGSWGVDKVVDEMERKGIFEDNELKKPQVTMLDKSGEMLEYAIAEEKIEGDMSDIQLLKEKGLQGKNDAYLTGSLQHVSKNNRGDAIEFAFRSVQKNGLIIIIPHKSNPAMPQMYKGLKAMGLEVLTAHNDFLNIQKIDWDGWVEDEFKKQGELVGNNKDIEKLKNITKQRIYSAIQNAQVIICRRGEKLYRSEKIESNLLFQNDTDYKLVFLEDVKINDKPVMKTETTGYVLPKDTRIEKLSIREVKAQMAQMDRRVKTAKDYYPAKAKTIIAKYNKDIDIYELTKEEIKKANNELKEIGMKITVKRGCYTLGKIR